MFITKLKMEALEHGELYSINLLRFLKHKRNVELIFITVLIQDQLNNLKNKITLF